jgi:hypothetical protein
MGYCGAGNCKNPLNRTVGQFCPPGFAEKIDEKIQMIAGEVESHSSSLLKGLPDYFIYRHFKNLSTMPTICPLGNATQLSIGANYYTPIHTEKDYFYTTLSCCTRSGEIGMRLFSILYFLTTIWQFP